jgi:hypothetical protein
LNGWALATRKIAKLGRVSEKIQTEFTLLWTDSRQPLCDDSHAFLDAMRVLFPRYQGRAVRLFRGAGTDEALKRKFFGVS